MLWGRLIGREHPVIPVPMLPRRRDEIGQAVQKLKRREVEDAVGSRQREFSPTAPSDPVGHLVPREHVVDLGDAAVCTAAHGESLERKGWPGAIPQQVLQALKIARHIAVEERDPDARVH